MSQNVDFVIGSKQRYYRQACCFLYNSTLKFCFEKKYKGGLGLVSLADQADI